MPFCTSLNTDISGTRKYIKKWSTVYFRDLYTLMSKIETCHFFEQCKPILGTFGFKKAWFASLSDVVVVSENNTKLAYLFLLKKIIL